MAKMSQVSQFWAYISECVRLLYWIYFKPYTFANWLRDIHPELKPDNNPFAKRVEFRTNPRLRRYAGQVWWLTVIVVDQASIHTSDVVLDKIEEWTERGITIFKLPSYSPELNLIEILWRFIKYEWIEIEAYKSWETFVVSVETILREFGKKYVINFV